ncbi:MAG: hypothetical protein OQK82_05690 [Candidatus Pacearchaeota archaeon]|nr:hypothetical protein [Candidatus Pacearchaeota archaeon]
MKNILFALLFLALNCQAETVTIQKHKLIGKWVSHLGYGAKPKPSTRIDYLTITKEFNISYERNISKSKKQIIKARNTEFHKSNEFYIIDFNTEKDTNFKLVFSGWVNGNEKLIFGMLYLYNKGQLFNGIPVSFKKSS